MLITSGVLTVLDCEHRAAIVCVNAYISGVGVLMNIMQRMSPPQDSTVNTCLIDGDRKVALNSCQCLSVSKTTVDLQGRSGQTSRMEWCFGVFGLGSFEGEVREGSRSCTQN